jgi:transcriptional regulator with GAF, ATPase, and Fis domain
MVGGSEAIQRLYAFIARLDKSLAPVLVRGETGSGKELVSRAIHEGSRVGGGPFVPINCGALPRELVASTLFGHKRGAFTGALDARRGAFGAADGGTLLLDEIGELPLDLQPALLRALETGEITAVGEDVPRRVSVRILAATHRDLAADVRAGRFREDLYYRLAAVTLEVPPLRERREDIPVLAELFARQEGWPSLPAEVIDELAAHSFPGNVRELRGLVVAHVTLGAFGPPCSSVRPSASVAGSVAVAPHLDAPFLEQRDALVESFTKLYLQKLLAAAHGNQSVAAKIAGLDRTYLGRLIAKESRK